MAGRQVLPFASATPVAWLSAAQYQASRFAATLRRQLYRNHLGLIAPQHCPSDRPEDVTAEMHFVGVPPNDFTNTEEDRFVAVRLSLICLRKRSIDDAQDPLGEELVRHMRDVAHTNTQCFDSVFHCVPTDQVRDWNEYVCALGLKVLVG